MLDQRQRLTSYKCYTNHGITDDHIHSTLKALRATIVVFIRFISGLNRS